MRAWISTPTPREPLTAWRRRRIVRAHTTCRDGVCVRIYLSAALCPVKNYPRPRELGRELPIRPTRIQIGFRAPAGKRNRAVHKSRAFHRARASPIGTFALHSRCRSMTRSRGFHARVRVSLSNFVVRTDGSCGLGKERFTVARCDSPM